MPHFSFQPPCPLPCGLRAGGLFDMFVTATFLSKAGLPHYSRFAADVFSLTTNRYNSQTTHCALKSEIPEGRKYSTVRVQCTL